MTKAGMRDNKQPAVYIMASRRNGTFETRGLTHPQMAEIKALLAPAAPGR